MSSTAKKQASETKLDLAFILDLLDKDGLIKQQQRVQLANISSDQGKIQIHPLITIAEQGWQDRVLFQTLDFLLCYSFKSILDY